MLRTLQRVDRIAEITSSLFAEIQGLADALYQSIQYLQLLHVGCREIISETTRGLNGWHA